MGALVGAHASPWKIMAYATRLYATLVESLLDDVLAWAGRKPMPDQQDVSFVLIRTGLGAGDVTPPFAGLSFVLLHSGGKNKAAMEWLARVGRGLEAAVRSLGETPLQKEGLVGPRGLRVEGRVAVMSVGEASKTLGQAGDLRDGLGSWVYSRLAFVAGDVSLLRDLEAVLAEEGGVSGKVLAQRARGYGVRLLDSLFAVDAVLPYFDRIQKVGDGSSPVPPSTPGPVYVGRWLAFVLELARVVRLAVDENPMSFHQDVPHGVEHAQVSDIYALAALGVLPESAARDVADAAETLAGLVLSAQFFYGRDCNAVFFEEPSYPPWGFPVESFGHGLRCDDQVEDSGSVYVMSEVEGSSLVQAVSMVVSFTIFVARFVGREDGGGESIMVPRLVAEGISLMLLGESGRASECLDVVPDAGLDCVSQVLLGITKARCVLFEGGDAAGVGHRMRNEVDAAESALSSLSSDRPSQGGLVGGMWDVVKVYGAVAAWLSGRGGDGETVLGILEEMRGRGSVVGLVASARVASLMEDRDGIEEAKGYGNQAIMCGLQEIPATHPGRMAGVYGTVGPIHECGGREKVALGYYGEASRLAMASLGADAMGGGFGGAYAVGLGCGSWALGCPLVTLVSTLLAEGRALRRAGDGGGAQRVLRTGLTYALDVGVYRSAPWFAMRVIEVLAHVEHDGGKLEAASALFLTAAAIREHVLGKCDLALVRLISNAGVMAAQKEEYLVAARALTKARTLILDHELGASVEGMRMFRIVAQNLEVISSKRGVYDLALEYGCEKEDLVFRLMVGVDAGAGAQDAVKVVDLP